MIQTADFVQSLWNFTCRLWMMRGGTLLILGHTVKGQVNFDTLCIRPCGHDTDYSFYQITFKLYMYVAYDERRNPIDFGSQVKSQGQLWHSVYKTLWTRYRLQFLSHHFQTSHVGCGWWGEEPYWFWVTGSKFKVNFGTLCKRPCGHDTNNSFCPITF